MITQGQRIYVDDKGNLSLKPGDYGKAKNGEWLARPPNPEIHTGSLRKHNVVEHDDGTITVSPSILISYQKENGMLQWHGHLEKGFWRQA